MKRTQKAGINGMTGKAGTIALMCAVGTCMVAASPLIAQTDPNPNPSWDDQWATLESAYLTDYVELTSESMFVKAGESYFSPDGSMIIFQAIPNPQDGQEADAHYSMYVASVSRDDDGAIVGLGKPGRVSSAGSSNTCGWFHPIEPMTILFGTTRVAPSGEDVAGFQRKTSKYSWQFPVEMDIMQGTLRMVFELSQDAAARAKAAMESGNTDQPKISMDDFVSVPALTNEAPIWERDGYDAEGSWSPDGRYILYTQLEPGTSNGDIWLYDSADESHIPLVTADGYDGGPFFAPDGKSICYRSDRHGDNLLQVFVSTLKFDESGKIVGVEEEKQLTDNGHVNWCPFYTPDGKYLLYATSEISHGNYEIYAIDATGNSPLDETPRLRITQARGFDGLPAFTKDGQWMIWTAQRGVQRDGEDRPSSQLWTAKINLDAIDKAYQSERKAMVDAKAAAEFESYTPEN